MCEPKLLVATWDSICPTLRGAHSWEETRVGAILVKADCPYCGAMWIGAEDEVFFYEKYGLESSFIGSDIEFINELDAPTHFRYL